jgi:hypothetical protein
VVFWLFALAMFVAICVSSYNDSFFAATLFLIMFGVAAHFAFKLDLTPYLPKTWKGWVVAVVAYIAIGALWSTFKFWTVYTDHVRYLKEVYENHEYLHKDYPTWNEYLDAKAHPVSYYRDRILCWLAYWPASAVAYVFADLLRDVFVWLYDQMSFVYQAIADRVRASFKE